MMWITASRRDIMATILHGTLREDGTLQLDEKVIGVPPGRVTVRLEPADAPSFVEVIEEIHRDQQSRGFQPRSMEELRADTAAQEIEDEEYDEGWRRIWDQTSTGCPPQV
jgi:hypothetical protein